MKKQIKQELLELSDLKYKKFHSKLCPGKDNIIGVRIPSLRDYAKQLIKENNIENLLDQIDDEFYEEVMLQGILIGMLKDDFYKVQVYIEKFVPKIDNWAICDIFCSGLKITKKYKKQMWILLQKYLTSNLEFEIRFAIVMILNYYIEENYLNQIFNIFDNITSKDYYAEMSVAWAISICLIKYYDETIKYLKNCKLDKFTYNKAIQKAIESYRITNDKKKELKALMK